MTARDRTVLLVVAVLAACAGFWLLILGPKRSDVHDLTTKVAAAQQRLDVAQAALADAQSARLRYNGDYATVARLGKAVPVDDDIPSLVYQLDSTAHRNHIDFRSIKLNATAAAPTIAASNTAAVASATGNTPPADSTASTVPATTAAAVLPPGASVGEAGFPTMPFTFKFQGSFFNMESFIRSLDDLTTVHKSAITVRGRLVTVDGFGLHAGPEGFPKIESTVAATAYLLPSDEGLTNGATADAPGGATTSTASSSATASILGSDR